MKQYLFIYLFTFCTSQLWGQSTTMNDTIQGKLQQRSSSQNETVAGYFTNGKKQYEGFRQKEQWHGLWISWYSNGQILDSGFFQKGIPDGTWQGWYENGNPKFTRNYSAEKWQLYKQEIVRYHPKKILLPISTVYHQNKKEAEKYTDAINTFCNPAKCPRASKEEFLQKINNNAGDHYHPLFDDGFLHGSFVNYFPDGAVKDSGNYKDGLPEGLWIKWTNDRQYYWKGFYMHGQKDKEWKLYMANGKLIRITLYKQGKLIWRKEIKEGAVKKEIDEI
jgi:antitoxin component YwqK of YwqJK toxin-antitoxin module